MSNENYNDADPDGLGDLKEIRRLPQMQKSAPKIRWGSEYLSWPIERRLNYAERLAYAMNHAADVLQQERNKLLVHVADLERKLEQNTHSYITQGELMHHELGMADSEKQGLYRQIVSLQSEVKEKDRRIRELEAQRDGNQR